MKIDKWEKSDDRGTKTSFNIKDDSGNSLTVHNNETGGGTVIHAHYSDGRDAMVKETDFVQLEDKLTKLQKDINELKNVSLDDE